MELLNDNEEFQDPRSFEEIQEQEALYLPVQTMFDAVFKHLKILQEHEDTQDTVNSVHFKASICAGSENYDIPLKFNTIHKDGPEETEVESVLDLEEKFWAVAEEACHNAHLTAVNENKLVLAYIKIEYVYHDKEGKEIYPPLSKQFNRPVYILGVLKPENDFLKFYAGEPKLLWKHFES